MRLTSRLIPAVQSLYKMLEGMGSRPSGDPKIRAKDIFSAIDVDQDGTLTCEEFVKGENINLSVALLIS